MKYQDFLVTGSIAVLWVLLYKFNHTVFKFTEVTPLTSLIFIPSGLKIAVSTIFRMRAWLGLFLGSLSTGYLFLNQFSPIDITIFSFLSASLPFVALKLCEYFLPLKQDLSNISINHIILMGLIYGLLNSFFHVGYRYHVLFVRDAHRIQEFIQMFVGDILGIFIVMLIIAKLSRLNVLQNFLKN